MGKAGGWAAPAFNRSSWSSAAVGTRVDATAEGAAWQKAHPNATYYGMSWWALGSPGALAGAKVLFTRGMANTTELSVWVRGEPAGGCAGPAACSQPFTVPLTSSARVPPAPGGSGECELVVAINSTGSGGLFRRLFAFSP
jgi:hypothetical protein